MRRQAVVHTDFQRIEVWGNGRQTEFRGRGATHAWWHRDRFLTGYTWDALAAACLLRPAGPPRTILMLGLAGGTSLRSVRHLLGHTTAFTAVELDRRMVRLAEHHMELGQLGVDIHLDDAYAWLERNRRRFDIVVDDVYAALDDRMARPGWGTRHFRLLRGAMARGGLLVANLLTGRGHRRMQVDLRAAFRAGFPLVRSVTTPLSANEVLVGGHDGVLAGGALRPWAARFPHTTDRRLWRDLRVRKI